MTTEIATRSLPTLVKLINREHELCERDYRNAALHAYRAGRYLLEAREEIPYGRWGIWLAETFPWGKSSAYNFIALAEKYGDVDDEEFQRGGKLTEMSLRGALRAINADKTPGPTAGSSDERAANLLGAVSATPNVIEGTAVDEDSRFTGAQGRKRDSILDAINEGLAYLGEFESHTLTPESAARLLRDAANCWRRAYAIAIELADSIERAA